MYKFSKKSLEKLNTVDQRLIDLFIKAIEISPIDFGIAEGLRDAETQNRYYKEGKSKLDGYNKKSKHQDGKAVDIYAYINGSTNYEIHNLSLIAGVVFAIAHELNIKIRWGGNWDMDSEILTDQSFDDLPHFELID